MKPPSSSLPLDAPARKAVAYVRRSTDRQDQSIGDQRRAIETYAEQRGFEIVGWYEDDAISGTSVDGRLAFKQMAMDAQAPGRDWQFILVYDVARLTRGDVSEGGYWRHQFVTAGVEVKYVAEGLTGGDADDLVIGVKQWMAQRYVKDLSKVTIRGQISHSESGAWCGGCPPYGYDLVYRDSTGRPYQHVRWLESGDKEVFDLDGRLTRMVPRGERLSASKRDVARMVPSTPERIAVICRIFNNCVDLGWGCKSIAAALNRDGIPSPRDGNWSSNARAKWSLSTIREILRNPAYRGDTAWNRRTFAKFHRLQGGAVVERPRIDADKPRQNPESDWIVVPNTHESLVPPPMFDRAQELMRGRARNVGPRNGRAGSGLRSPFLLSGLVTCARCGQAYQGRTINSTKHRKDGSKIKTLYYACGGWVMKGASACEKFLIRKEPLEDLLLERIQDRLESLLTGEGESILRQYIEEEIGAQGQDPRRELATLRARIKEIDVKADVLLEGLSADTKGFVDAKLRDLGVERRKLQSRCEALEAIPYDPIDADAVLRGGLASLRDLPRLLESGSLEDRKEFVRAFVAGVSVVPGDARLDVQMRTLPALDTLRPGNSTCRMVAGARYEPLQIEMRPMERFLAGLRRAA
jgi:DNA invertase Pin-like site-specific DNA recombinase